MSGVMELAEKPSTELTVQDRAALALASDKTRQELMIMATKSAHLVEIKNKAGRDEIHSAAMVLAGARIAISKTGKAARDDATKFSKAVIAEEASLIAIVQPEETRLLALRDYWDEVVARREAAKEAAERARILDLTGRIAAIREYITLAASCRTAARINELLDKLAKVSLTDFEEFADEAAATHADAMKRFEALLVEKQLVEQEQIKIKAEQEQAAAKLKAEQEAFATQQAAAQAAAAKVAEEHAAQVAKDKADAEAARKALADERAAFDLQVAESKRVAEQADELAEQERFKAAVLKLDEETPITPIVPVEQASIAIETVAGETLLLPDMPRCCEKAAALGVQVCPDCAEPAWEPTDAEVMWEAIKAVASAFDWSTEQATTRLAAVQWTI